VVDLQYRRLQYQEKVNFGKLLQAFQTPSEHTFFPHHFTDRLKLTALSRNE
jgi:hypothetical protein